MSEELNQDLTNTGAENASVTPELTIQDLNNIRSIIDVAAQRGAFRAAEFAAVGTTFNKLNDFLNAVSPPATEADTDAAA
jgi:hypothetical protein